MKILKRRPKKARVSRLVNKLLLRKRNKMMTATVRRRRRSLLRSLPQLEMMRVTQMRMRSLLSSSQLGTIKPLRRRRRETEKDSRKLNVRERWLLRRKKNKLRRLRSKRGSKRSYLRIWSKRKQAPSKRRRECSADHELKHCFVNGP